MFKLFPMQDLPGVLFTLIPEQLRGHKSAISLAIFSPSSAQIISCAHDKTIRTWDIAQKSALACKMHSNRASPDTTKAVAVSPTGDHIVCPVSFENIGGKGMGIWHVETGGLWSEEEGRRLDVEAVAFS